MMNCSISIRNSLASYTNLCMALLFIASTVVNATHCRAVTWRSDVTNEQVIALAQQQQFKGSGIVIGPSSSGSGVAIAPGWVMTAAHVVGNNSSSRFILDGVTYQGVSVTTQGTGFAESDVALIRLNPNSQLPNSTPFIAPINPNGASNPNADLVGDQVWIAGRGAFGPRGGGPLSRLDATVRAGTNVITGRDNVIFNSQTTDAIIYQQNDTSANSTDFEVSTAPGDSGGATYYQHNNQWYVVGTTIGIIVDRPDGNLRVRPAQADVASVYDWIETTTGLNFTPQAAPTELIFDSNFSAPGVQSESPPGFSKVWDTTLPVFTGGADGFNFAWENDFAPTAVFGTATTQASVVQVQDDITFGGIRFDPTSATGNADHFQINDDGGSLQAKEGGATIEVNQFSAIGANLVGTASRGITKTGDAELRLNGSGNAGFDAQFNVTDGTLSITSNESLGGGTPSESNKTTVASGATLQLMGSGITANERLNISGTGHNGNGVLKADSGNHALTEQIELQADSEINVATSASLTIGGANGKFLHSDGESWTLTQAGEGTVVYNNVNDIAHLIVADGVAAGNGGIDGSLTLQSGAELRPGDQALTSEIETFQIGDLTLDDGSILTIDIDPFANTFDSLVLGGPVDLGGSLNVNLLSAPVLGQSFLIVSNEMVDAVSGRFSNGNFVTSDFGGQAYRFSIDYASGSSGSNIRLSSVSAIPEPGSAGLLACALCVIGLRRRSR